ncbi:MAG: hypothetical protein EOP04_24385 [Proteobacteria bacterium]|nr:MAG: hypothetical protein EOP04_24385 [Pseudomonadota bacterium]
MPNLRLIGTMVLALIPVGMSSVALASASASSILCKKYPESTYCDSPVSTCKTCHSSPPNLNAFGLDLRDNLSGPLATALEGALLAIESDDSDGDGVTNLIELKENKGN